MLCGGLKHILISSVFLNMLWYFYSSSHRKRNFIQHMMWCLLIHLVISTCVLEWQLPNIEEWVNNLCLLFCEGILHSFCNEHMYNKIMTNCCLLESGRFWVSQRNINAHACIHHFNPSILPFVTLRRHIITCKLGIDEQSWHS